VELPVTMINTTYGRFLDTNVQGWRDLETRVLYAVFLLLIKYQNV